MSMEGEGQGGSITPDRTNSVKRNATTLLSDWYGRSTHAIAIHHYTRSQIMCHCVASGFNVHLEQRWPLKQGRDKKKLKQNKTKLSQSNRENVDTNTTSMEKPTFNNGRTADLNVPR